jgi:hypothetical protein
MFVIFDLGRYAITVQSLHMLANAGARAWMICDAKDVILGLPPADCTGDLVPDSDKQAIAPLLYAGGLKPKLDTTLGASAYTVTASEPSFTMLMPIWSKVISSAPSVSTSIPF